MIKLLFSLSVLCVAATTGQRITTINLDGIQYYVSRMNPYSPELNYYLAYQYCRSIGLQLASFDSKEKYEAMVEYLRNAGFYKYDFWTSGNRLGTQMFLWMSTGLPFNATFSFFDKSATENSIENNGNTSPQRTARDNAQQASREDCVLLKAPDLMWEANDCLQVKDFICEQTRCYYYNYGSIPVSTSQGRKYTQSESASSTTPAPTHQEIKDTTAFYVSLMGSHSSSEEVEEQNNSSSNDDTTTEVVHEEGEHEGEEVDEHPTASSEISHESEEQHEDEEVPVEQRLRQLTDDLGRLDKISSNDDETRQSFLSLSDLIKTLRPDDQKPLQIDSSYSRSQVLGEKPDVVYHPRNTATADITNRSL